VRQAVSLIRVGFRWIQALWLGFGVVLLTLASLELSAAAIRGARQRRAWENYVSGASRAATDPAAARRFYAEMSRLRYRIMDDGLWRARPQAGEALNVDGEGLRSTRYPAPPPAKGAKTIFVFGGSTVWGWGSRDEKTIPSLLGGALVRAGMPVAVRNYGQNAYVSSQEVAALVGELRGGARPDVVVFLDGLNDVEAAFLAEGGDATFERRFLRRSGAALQSDTRWDLVRAFLSGSALARLFAWGGGRPPSKETGEAAADRVARRYLANVELVRALAPRYRFTPVFFWQPVIARKRRLTDAEKETQDLGDYEPEMKPVFDLLSRRIGRAARDERVHDIGELFSEESRAVYTDGEHYTEAANAVIAENMSAVVLAETAAGKRKSE
jgi:lysophospholipase L1-like esterase